MKTDIIHLLNSAPSPLDVQLVDEDLPEKFYPGEWLGVYDRSGKLLLLAHVDNIYTPDGEKI